MTVHSDKLRKALDRASKCDNDELRKRGIQEAYNRFAKEVMDEISDAANWGNEAKVGEALSNGLMFQHRTLQQGIFRILRTMFKNYAEAGQVSRDARNEMAIQLAEKWADTEGFLPLI